MRALFRARNQCSGTLVKELFAWLRFRNRREVAGCLGLAPSPYASGESEAEQGISKAGNRRVRTLMVELAWSWLRYQPQSITAPPPDQQDTKHDQQRDQENQRQTDSRKSPLAIRQITGGALGAAARSLTRMDADC